MTIICHHCEQTIREACPVCATPAVRLKTWRGMLLRWLLGTPRMWACPRPECSELLFMEGCGGLRHGLCEPCVVLSSGTARLEESEKGIRLALQ